MGSFPVFGGFLLGEIKMLITNDQDTLQRWILDHDGINKIPSNFVAVGKLIRGKIVAVAGFSNYSKKNSSIFGHMAGTIGKYWFTKDLREYFFYYPFVTLNLRNFYLSIKTSNKKSLELAYKLGFKAVCSINAEETVIIMRMKKDECKYIPK